MTQWRNLHPTGETDLLSVAQVWQLSKLWYRDRMDETFSGRSIAEAHAIFAQLNLPAPFWRFDD